MFESFIKAAFSNNVNNYLNNVKNKFHFVSLKMQFFEFFRKLEYSMENVNQCRK